MWKKHLSLLIIVFGVIGYCLAAGLFNAGVIVDYPTSQIFQFVTLVKQIFFSALKMLITPIVLFSLLSGMMHISAVSHLGQLGKTTLFYYLTTTTIAICIGLFVVFFIHPWQVSAEKVEPGQKIESTYQSPAKQVNQKEASLMSVASKMAKTIFVNPINAFADNNILGIVFWAFLIGLAFMAIGPVDQDIVKLITQFNLVLNKILGWVILFAPLGVFAIAFTFYFQYTGTILWQLLSFMAVVFGATMFHGLVVLPMFLKFFTEVSIVEFFKKSSKALLLAFSTSSSAATLPVSIKVCEEEFNVSPSVSSFVLPLGATMNMDGTALFEGVAAIFLAYIFHIELNTISMVSIFLMAVISSIGAPGMPSGSMSGMQMVLLAAGIPLEGIGVLMVVERPLDTFRTAVNVQGDIIGAIVVDRTISKQSPADVSTV